MDLQGPLPRRPLPPAVDSHELPALETFIGVVKHPAMVMPPRNVTLNVLFYQER